MQTGKRAKSSLFLLPRFLSLVFSWEETWRSRNHPLLFLFLHQLHSSSFYPLKKDVRKEEIFGDVFVFSCNEWRVCSLMIWAKRRKGRVGGNRKAVDDDEKCNDDDDDGWWEDSCVYHSVTSILNERFSPSHPFLTTLSLILLSILLPMIAIMLLMILCLVYWSVGRRSVWCNRWSKQVFGERCQLDDAQFVECPFLFAFD